MKKKNYIQNCLFVIISLFAFFFSSCRQEPTGPPTISTAPISNITALTATSGGEIISANGFSVTKSGLCWATYPSPSIADDTTVNSTTSGSFVSIMTGLTPNTTYYVRAYATNAAGEGYGDVSTFTTSTSVPTMTTKSISNLMGTRATSGGDITFDGGATITERGVCWGTTATPTIADNKTVESTSVTNFTLDMTGMALNTTYYVRAYATNGVGTGYGNAVSFTTTSVLSVGDSYQGGVIAYFLQSGEPGYDPNVLHGLAAAPSDQSAGIAWWNGSYVFVGTGTLFGTGATNTSAIVAGQGIGSYAAKICNDLVLNGRSDWYLPSKIELNILYVNKDIIGGFDTYYYWSSSQNSNSGAWAQYFTGGGQNSYDKTSMMNVRAVRTF